MSFWRFFRDRLFAVCVFIITWAMLMIFLLALSCGISALIATSSLLLIGGTITLLWDFLRRRDFYNRINTSLESLDNKYLISTGYDSLILSFTTGYMGNPDPNEEPKVVKEPDMNNKNFIDNGNMENAKT